MTKEPTSEDLVKAFHAAKSRAVKPTIGESLYDITTTILALLLVALTFSYPLELAWNASVAQAIDGCREITFKQAFAALVALRILVGFPTMCLRGK